MTEWIKCSDRLPDIKQEVLIHDGTHFYVAYRCLRTAPYKHWEWVVHCECSGVEFDGDYSAQYWMPLPEIPNAP